MTNTNKKAATQEQPCAARESTNRREHNTSTARCATPERRRWRPVTIGEVIERLMTDIGMETRHG